MAKGKKQAKTGIKDKPPGPRPLHGCDALDVAIAELLDKKPGMTNWEIGQVVGLHEHAVLHRRHAARFEAMYAARHPPAKEFYRNVRPIARKKLLELLDSEQDGVALKVCERLLGVDLAPTHEESAAASRASTAVADRVVEIVKEADEIIRRRSETRRAKVGAKPAA